MMECPKSEETTRYITAFEEILNNMANKMLLPNTSNSITVNFIEDMIPHHEGAIAMSKNVLRYPIDPRLEKMTKPIVQEQSRRIRQLKEAQIHLC